MYISVSVKTRDLYFLSGVTSSCDLVLLAPWILLGLNLVVSLTNPESSPIVILGLLNMLKNVLKVPNKVRTPRLRSRKMFDSSQLEFLRDSISDLEYKFSGENKRICV